MEITLDLIVFTVLAVFTLASAVLAVTTKRILRAATFLLFVLFGTAGIYFQLNYSFLGAVQLLIYAGGITVLYVFSILLTSSEGDKAEKLRGYKFVVGILATLAGLAICLFVTLRHQFLPEHFEHGELAVRIRVDESRKTGLPAAVRSHQFIAAGLHRRRYPDRPQTIIKRYQKE